MAGDRDEEEVSLIGIVGAEATLANVLEEVALAGVLPGELSRSLVVRVGIAVGVYVNLESLLHLRVVQTENLRQMENIRELLLFHDLSLHLYILYNWYNDGDMRGRGGRERATEGTEGEASEGDEG